MKIYRILYYVIVLSFTQCKTHWIPVADSNERITIKDNITQSDSSDPLENYLSPFRDSLQKIMRVKIGEATQSFIKEKPGGSLGNLVVDAMQQIALQQPKPDQYIGAIMNYGGIRIAQISAGNITIGQVYELLPFENEIVVVHISGQTLQTWLEHIRSQQGWPISTAIWQLYNTKQIQPDNTYHVITNDYLANGGDQCIFLKNEPRTHTGVTVRDAVIRYISEHHNLTPDPTVRLLK